MSFLDKFLQQYNLSIHKTDGKRLLRWMRHIRDHQGKLTRMISRNWNDLNSDYSFLLIELGIDGNT